LDFHHLVAEATLEKIEIEAVERDEFWQQHVFQHILTFKTVAKHKATSFRGVRMQVDIDLKIFILVLLDNCPFYSINGGLKFGAGVDIEPVKIFG